MGCQEAQKLNASMVAENEMIYNAFEVIREMEEEMQKASSRLEFEKAAHLRDQIKELKKRAGIEESDSKRKSPVDYPIPGEQK